MTTYKQSGRLAPKSFLLYGLLLILSGVVLAPAAHAATVHGYCVAPAAACSDNGTVTPTGDNPPYFAFSFSGNAGKDGSGNLWLVGLVPDNQNAGFNLTLNGTNTTNSTATAVLGNPGVWSSGFLGSFLSTPNFGSNAHPISAWLPSTQAVDPGAQGYYVYTFDFGAFNYANTADPQFSVSSGSVPIGTLFLAGLGDTNNNITVDTPNSATLLETANPQNPVPEPGTLAMLGTAVLGIAGLLRRKIRV
jgi:hypothetical protein